MIAFTHPIKSMISSQYEYLRTMLELFPNLLNEWYHKETENVEELAKEISDGDYEIYTTAYNSEIQRVESYDDQDALFNHAMLIMVYSYYESILFKLAKENGIRKSNPSAIAKHFNVTLDDEDLKISEYLYNTIRLLRNQLCHNNGGTLFAKSKDEEIENIMELKKTKIITIEDNRITIICRDFIMETLTKEYKLLLKLAEICNYKTSHIGA